MELDTPPEDTVMRERHPPALWILFFSELWERFSYYGMRALLVLYMLSDVLKYDREHAYSTYGAYAALVYASPILGGWLADKVLGYRNSIMLGGVLMAAGHFLMAIETEWVFFGALALIATGNGFFKPNISSTVGKLYAPGDPMRDRGFSIFYMGINIGAFTAPLLCGWLGENIGWHYGFGAAGVGMLIGLAVFWRGQHLLEGKADPPSPEMFQKWRVPVWLGAFGLVPIVGLLMANPSIAKKIVYAASAIALIFIFRIALKMDKVARERIYVFMILFVFHMLFWALFEQAGSSLTTYARDVTDRSIMGWLMPTSWAQSFNPFFIVTFAPIFTLIWALGRARNKEPNIPAKFGLGVIQLGLGYGLLVIGAGMVGENGLVPLFILVFCYLLHTTGELCLSPVGLSAVTKLAPKAQVGFFMGAWFLSISLANAVAAEIAKLTGSAEEFAITASLPVTADLDALKTSLEANGVTGLPDATFAGMPSGFDSDAIVEASTAALATTVPNWDGVKDKVSLSTRVSLSAAELKALNDDVDRISEETGTPVVFKDKVTIDPAKTYETRELENFTVAIQNKIANLMASLDPERVYPALLLQIVDESLDGKLGGEAGDHEVDPTATYTEEQSRTLAGQIREKVDLLKAKAIEGYTTVYKGCAIGAIIAGLLLLLASGPIGRMTHGVK